MIIKNNKELKQKDFRNERELQTYIDANLGHIFGYKVIATEFAVGSFRIDTLAFDEENNCFKIIEYKNVLNHSLIDQGYTYLRVMLEHKGEFVLKYNERTGANKGIKDFDWSQSKAVFVSPIFTKFQLNGTAFKNIPVDLVRVTRYEDDIVYVELIEKNSNIKIEDIHREYQQNEITREIKVYTEEDHLKYGTSAVRSLYTKLKDRILELDDIDVDVKKTYIAFKGSRNVCDIVIFKNKINVQINVKKGTLVDPYNFALLVDEKGHLGNGDYKALVKNEEDIDNIIPLIKQSLKINKK